MGSLALSLTNELKIRTLPLVDPGCIMSFLFPCFMFVCLFFKGSYFYCALARNPYPWDDKSTVIERPFMWPGYQFCRHRLKHSIGCLSAVTLLHKSVQ